MKKIKDYPYLRQIMLNILFYRLFLPLMIVVLIVIGGFAYLSEKNVESHQNSVVQSVCHMVNYHLEHGKNTLNIIANVAEKSDDENLFVFMKSAWESGAYFDTIYYLDKNNRILNMIPANPKYSELDMSNLPDLKKSKEDKNNIVISRPFISIRTGCPTVYLIKSLSNGGTVIGELNLELLQNEIVSEINASPTDFIYIMDQSGTLLAHHSLNLVKQQTNMSNLDIFNKVNEGKSNDIYSYNKKLVFGSGIKLEETGWIVVDQISIFKLVSSYAVALGWTLLVSLIIWLGLTFNLRKQLKLYVVTPLEELTKTTNALTSRDFKRRNLLSSGSTVFYELNKLLVNFKFMTNSLKLREDALRESEKRYRGLVERLSIGIFRTTLKGEIIGANPMTIKIFGYSQNEELYGVNIIDFFDKAIINEKEKQFILDNIYHINKYETMIKCDNNEVKWVLMDLHIFHDPQGQEEILECSIQDITERKNTELKIKEQQELIFKAEEEKLEVLERALVMKDEFISLITHELKTPLNVIYSAIQLIEYVYIDKIPEKVRDLIGNIKQNTFRQIRLSDNLLDVTKLNSGYIKLNKKNIDIVFLCKIITESVESYAVKKDIKVSFKSNVQSKIISMDREKFIRIILNLLSNAMKFTEDGGKIDVIVNENIEFNLVQIKIKDTGIGIPKDKQELIFERFGQVNNNLSRLAEGSGIGLSLVKLLVDSIEGTIEVESELGMGSAFIITLPAKKKELDNEVETCLEVEGELVAKMKVEFSDIYL